MAETKAKKSKILIVDDDTSLVEVLEFVMGREGFDVQSAVSGDQALAKVAADPPDLIVLDLLIPRVSGLEVLRNLQSQGHGHIPVIIITGRYAGDPAYEEMIRLEPNVKDFLKKPVGYVYLSARIRQLLGTAGHA